MIQDNKDKLLESLWALLGNTHYEREIAENLIVVKGFVRDFEKYQQKFTALGEEFPYCIGGDDVRP
jgi:hypothetical protein